MSKSALVLVADGSEEMEAVISIDVLRRAGVRMSARAILIFYFPFLRLTSSSQDSQALAQSNAAVAS